MSSSSKYSVSDLRNVIGGILDGVTFYYFTSDESLSSGGGDGGYHRAQRVMRLVLPRSYPHIVIRSRSDSTLPAAFSNDQRITLEGDFDEFFELYVPDTAGVEALTILTPDVMQTLIKHATGCDMEVMGNSLYFYWPASEYDVMRFPVLFEMVGRVLDSLGTALWSYTPESRVASSAPVQQL